MKQTPDPAAGAFRKEAPAAGVVFGAPQTLCGAQTPPPP
ncbi:hypothetical protein BH11ACT6_BH11ACT6_49830 [soil metagenome]